MGKLMIEGTLDLSQFWPIGESDADTTKIVLTVLPGADQYQPAGDVPRPTTKFDGACVRSVGQLKPVIKNGRITVRLQGLDAPELHYQPQSMKGKTYKGKPFGSLKGSGLVKKYRQHQAKTATVRLSRYLSTFGTSPLLCRFQTEVNDHEGPADGVGPIPDFDPQLLYQKPATATLIPEKTKKFIRPKLSCRQCTWWAYRKLGTFKGGFDTYLSLFPDGIFYERSGMRDEGFLAATPFQLEKMVKAGRQVVYAPDEVVFKEAGSQLFTAEGQLIRKW